MTSFPLANIQTASIVGVVEKKLKVRAGATDLTFKSGHMSRDDSSLKDMAKLLHRAMAGEPLRPPGTTAANATPPPAASHSSEAGVSWIVELERLAKLHTEARLPTRSSSWRNARCSPAEPRRVASQQAVEPATDIALGDVAAAHDEAQ